MAQWACVFPLTVSVQLWIAAALNCDDWYTLVMLREFIHPIVAERLVVIMIVIVRHRYQ
jgi:hypothetical protein